MWVTAILRRRQWHPTPVLLPGKSHGWRSLVGWSPWGREESDMTEQLHFHALEKEMATHSSVLAWRIPGTAESGGLLCMESHRVGNNWSDLGAAALQLQFSWSRSETGHLFICYHKLWPIHAKAIDLLFYLSHSTDFDWIHQVCKHWSWD